MRCPQCQFDHEAQSTECFKCGMVFAKYLRYQEALVSSTWWEPSVRMLQGARGFNFRWQSAIRQRTVYWVNVRRLVGFDALRG